MILSFLAVTHKAAVSPGCLRARHVSTGKLCVPLMTPIEIPTTPDFPNSEPVNHRETERKTAGGGLIRVKPATERYTETGIWGSSFHLKSI